MHLEWREGLMGSVHRHEGLPDSDFLRCRLLLLIQCICAGIDVFDLVQWLQAAAKLIPLHTDLPIGLLPFLTLALHTCV